MKRIKKFDWKTDWNIGRGDLYFADLYPVRGSEQGGVRPVLVIQNDIGNHFSPTIIVAVLTGKKRSEILTHVSLEAAFGLKKESTVMLEQLRTIDRERITGYIGHLDGPTMRQVDWILAASVGLLPFGAGQNQDK